ncbi:MAG: hypothetical protein BCS36_00645 [Desulfovibrio sp. MES5]|uniref:respiratory nitrate reductase subunit gamma n=1 Tax=Desulfovibrio sp. MES5 TaxID=1899016 RepID=UPI000B9CEAAA|nr:respiratory nitrate reductase subunit gamma [Desulfovibrio sp. MES5]OXS28235.1 MAG: hypothetical protein BCS36_00645 [Desulfovibrio sp. MES5]
MKLWFTTRHTAASLPMLLVAFLLVLAVCWLRPAAAHAGSSWLIDEMRFHASAHSALSCTDCHTDIAEAAEHPTAKGLNQPGSTAFSAEGCYNCHSEVEAELAKGKHAGKNLVKGQDYAQCITCHNPHYVLGAESRAKGLRKGGNIAQSCNVCHEMKKALPVPAADVAACLTCHGLQTGVAQAASGAAAVSDAGKGAAPQAQIPQAQTSQGQSPQGQISQAQTPKGQAPQGQSQQALALQPRALCMTCHGPEGRDMPGAARMDAQALAAMTHKNMDCLSCHKDAARYPHNRQERVPCLTCHTRHTESVIHDAHSRVSCESCHLQGVTPELKNGMVVARVDAGPFMVHDMRLPSGTASCVRCHSPAISAASPAGAGSVGAADAVLPAKSVLCMGCHAGAFTVQDTPSRLGFSIFVLGFVALMLFWFSTTNLGKGSLAATSDTQSTADGTGQTHGCPRPEHHGKGENRWLALLYDVLLQRRLFRESRTRWAIHALIFFPFVIRFSWGMLALFGSHQAAATEWPWLMLDKDWAPTAFIYDVSGLALLAGLVWAALFWRREKLAAANAPRHDWPALWLLLAITVTGFVLEGMRIALTGMPDGSEWAFAGYALASLFGFMSPAELARVYGWGWYAHAIVTAATVAYMPFSQLRHIVATPVFLLVQTLRGKH